MQFGYKHGTYKIDINSKTVDNFQKLDLVLEDGGGGTARKTITNDYSYNLDSYYDYILKYSYEGKSSSILCKVGNYDRISGTNQLYNITSDGDPGGIFFSLDASCPLPYGWNAASIVDNFDLSIFSNTELDIPVVYEFIKKNKGLSLKSFIHKSIKLYIFSSNFHFSPFGPLP